MSSPPSLLHGGAGVGSYFRSAPLYFFGSSCGLSGIGIRGFGAGAEAMGLRVLFERTPPKVCIGVFGGGRKGRKAEFGGAGGLGGFVMIYVCASVW